MSKKKQLTISEFARLTGIKRDTLRFYDRIGLLSPEHRGDNKYRYYSRHQLNTAYFISGLRGVGVGIETIKQYESIQSPKESLALFAQQEKRIQKEIEQLKETQSIMKLYTEMIKEALLHEEQRIFIQKIKREPIFLCPPIPSHMNEDEAGIFSYDFAEEHGVNLGYPMGNIVEVENVDEHIKNGIGRYYFKTNTPCNAYKEEGLYAVAYGDGDTCSLGALYAELFIYIQEHGYCTCGYIYEEYPLNDISLHAKEHYGTRLEVRIKKVDH